uniref:Uncharacterized protein n=1 Tax=Kalanchoe fedtschenkoi TaxID=63787 RepID=A0A7N0SVN1_KALFE
MYPTDAYRKELRKTELKRLIFRSFHFRPLPIVGFRWMFCCRRFKFCRLLFHYFCKFMIKLVTLYFESQSPLRLLRNQ